MSEIAYSTALPTVKQAIMMQRASEGNWEATASLIAERTDIPIEVILNMNLDDVIPILEKVSAGLQAAMNLYKLSKQFEDS